MESNPKVEVNDPNDEEEETYDSLEEYFIDCCRFGDEAEAKQCIQDGVDINYVDNYLNTPLHMASANGHIGILNMLVAVKKDDKPVCKIDAQNSEGNTALHWAVLTKQKEAVKFLTENGINCRIKNAQDKTALDDAFESENFEIGEMIAKYCKPTPEELKEMEKEAADLKEEEAGEDEEEKVEKGVKEEKIQEPGAK